MGVDEFLPLASTYNEKSPQPNRSRRSCVRLVRSLALAALGPRLSAWPGRVSTAKKNPPAWMFVVAANGHVEGLPLGRVGAIAAPIH